MAILFCRACSTEVSLKLSSVIQPIKGNKKREWGTGSRHSVCLESWKRRNGDTINSIHASLTEYYDAKFNVMNGARALSKTKPSRDNGSRKNIKYRKVIAGGVPTAGHKY